MAGRHRLRRTPLVITVVAVVVVLGGGAGVWAATRSDSGAAAATTTTRTVAATVQTLKQTVSSSGTIEPKTQSDLGFASSGTVTSVKVAVGDVVTAGQALATIDPTDLEDAYALAQAQLDTATTALTSAEADGTATAIAAAQAQVDSTTAKRDQARSDLAGATLTSPIAGTVAAVDLMTGSTVSGGSGSSAASAGGTGGIGGTGGTGGTSGSSGSSSAQITVISTGSWVVDASVGSADLAALKKGLQATITPSGAATPVFGTVSSVGVIASSSTSGSATFPVTIAVTGSPTGLYAGGTATVVITTKQVADALTVPTAAIRSENGQSTVMLVRNGTTTSTPVTLGLVSGQTTQVTAGLSAGDEVQVETRGFGGAGTGGTRTTQGRTGTGGYGQNGGGTGGFPGGGAPGGGQAPGQGGNP